VIAAILYAADPISEGGAGANIINMSLGATFARGGGNTGAGALVAAMNEAVNYATSRNVLCVSSAGNSAIDMDHSGSITNVPAQSGSGIAVSATAPVNWVGNPPGDFMAPASYTNYGYQLVWVSAPGGDFAYPGNENCSGATVSPAGSIVRPCWVFDGVFSPGNQSGGYFWASGTSMAAPHVSGIAALLVQKYPGILVGDLKGMIAQTAVDAGAIGADPYHGHGFANANNAVSSTAQSAGAKPQRPEVAAGAAKVELTIYRNGSSSPDISFVLPAAGPARVDLYDVAGRRVAELFNGQANAGRTFVSWSMALRQGTYFARLTAAGVQTARQVVMLGQ
jgi:subtilisin family serine protease